MIPMAKEIVKEASTIEEAKALAVAALGVAEDQIEFVVLQEPQKKALGLFGGCDAIVKATVKEACSPAAAAEAYLRDILAAFGKEDVAIDVEENEEGATLRIDGEHLGFIIGRRGDTLDALQ